MFSATAWSLIIIGECIAYLILASDKVETTYESKAKSNNLTRTLSIGARQRDIFKADRLLKKG